VGNYSISPISVSTKQPQIFASSTAKEDNIWWWKLVLQDQYIMAEKEFYRLHQIKMVF